MYEDYDYAGGYNENSGYGYREEAQSYSTNQDYGNAYSSDTGYASQGGEDFYTQNADNRDAYQEEYGPDNDGNAYQGRGDGGWAAPDSWRGNGGEGRGRGHWRGRGRGGGGGGWGEWGGEEEWEGTGWGSRGWEGGEVESFPWRGRGRARGGDRGWGADGWRGRDAGDWRGRVGGRGAGRGVGFERGRGRGAERGRGADRGRGSERGRGRGQDRGRGRGQGMDRQRGRGADPQRGRGRGKPPGGQGDTQHGAEPHRGSMEQGAEELQEAEPEAMADKDVLPASQNTQAEKMDTAEIETQDKGGDQGTSYCKFCKLSFPNDEKYRLHTEGLLHAQKMKEMEVGKTEVDQQTEEDGTTVPDSSTTPAQAPENREKVDEEAKEKSTQDTKQVAGNRPEGPGKGKPSKDFICQLCNISCTCAANLEMHMNGKQHKATLERYAPIFLENGGVLKTSKKRITSQRSDGPSLLLERLKKSHNKAVGLQFITEYQRPKDKDFIPTFVCSLCESKVDISGAVPHTIGAKHRYKFLERYHPQVMEAVLEMKKSASQEEVVEFLREMIPHELERRPVVMVETVLKDEHVLRVEDVPGLQEVIEMRKMRPPKRRNLSNEYERPSKIARSSDSAHSARHMDKEEGGPYSYDRHRDPGDPRPRGHSRYDPGPPEPRHAEYREPPPPPVDRYRYPEYEEARPRARPEYPDDPRPPPPTHPRYPDYADRGARYPDYDDPRRPDPPRYPEYDYPRPDPYSRYPGYADRRAASCSRYAEGADPRASLRYDPYRRSPPASDPYARPRPAADDPLSVEDRLARVRQFLGKVGEEDSPSPESQRAQQPARQPTPPRQYQARQPEPRARSRSPPAARSHSSYSDRPHSSRLSDPGDSRLHAADSRLHAADSRAYAADVYDAKSHTSSAPQMTTGTLADLILQQRGSSAPKARPPPSQSPPEVKAQQARSVPEGGDQSFRLAETRALAKILSQLPAAAKLKLHSEVTGQDRAKDNPTTAAILSLLSSAVSSTQRKTVREEEDVFKKMKDTLLSAGLKPSSPEERKAGQQGKLARLLAPGGHSPTVQTSSDLADLASRSSHSSSRSPLFSQSSSLLRDQRPGLKPAWNPPPSSSTPGSRSPSSAYQVSSSSQPASKAETASSLQSFYTSCQPASKSQAASSPSSLLSTKPQAASSSSSSLLSYSSSQPASKAQASSSSSTSQSSIYRPRVKRPSTFI